MPVEAGKAIFSLEADDSKLNAQLKSAEQKVDQSSREISAKMLLMAGGIGGAIGSVIGPAVQKMLGELEKIPAFFLDAYKVTAEYGLEMEHLGTRMGMTAQQAATLTGMMERQGLGAGVAARAMQIMSAEARQTGEALDPLNTRLGRILGTLRESDGQLMNTSQILDLARQKIQGASSATEQLQLAQQIFGTRMGGQLLPMLKLTNEEWEKQKASVEESLGPVDEASEQALAYKQATEELEQKLKGLQITIGNNVLPSVIKLTEAMSKAASFIKHELASEADVDGMKALAAAIHKAAEAGEKPGAKPFALSDMDMKNLELYAHAMKDLTQDAEKAQQLGLITSQQRAAIDKQDLEVIEEQRKRYQQVLDSGAVSQQTKIEYEAKILQFMEREAEISRKQAHDEYSEQELRAKSLGLVNSTTEIQFLQRQVADARIVGDERLKIEADLFNKKIKYAEDVVKISRELGFMQINDEIKFREGKAKDLLSRGDVLGAAGEMKQIKELRIREGDAQEEFRKHIQIVSIQSEIDFQREKLNVVRGNADEERKIIQSIADLDKNLYEQRIQYAANYASTISKAGKAVLTASGAGEQMTEAQARVEAERQNTEAGHTARQIAETGGSEEQRAAAIAWAQTMKKQVEEMAKTGEELSERMNESWDNAKAIFSAYGVKNVKDPTGPSATVGSALSETEGLSTANLGRGSQIPNLDTSYTDLAIRIRDVFLGTIPNITSFSDAIKQATQKLTGSFGNPINAPVGVGPGGGQQFGPGSSLEALPTGSTSPAQPLTSIDLASRSPNFAGAVPVQQTQEVPGLADLVKVLSEHNDSQAKVTEALNNAKDILSKLGDLRTSIQIGIDPDSSDKFKALSKDAFVEALRVGG